MGHPDINVNLIRSFSPYNKDTALSLVSKYEKMEILHLLLDHPTIDVNKADPLYRASAKGLFEVASILMQNPNIQETNFELLIFISFAFCTQLADKKSIRQNPV